MTAWQTFNPAPSAVEPGLWHWALDTMGDWASRCKAKCKATRHIINSRPHVIIVPLVLAALMMGLGIWAVMAGSEHYADSYRAKALSHVEAASSTLQLSIREAALPAMQLADLIKHTLNYTTLQSVFEARVTDWWATAPKAAMSMSMAPFGTVSRAFPMEASFLLGFDILAHPVIKYMVYESILNGGVTLAEPNFIDGNYIMTFQVPILIKNVSESETWGIPYKPTDCPPGLCYNATTRTRWWGNCALSVNVSAFITTDGPLATLAKAGYNIQIWRPPSLLARETERMVVSEKDAIPQPADAVRGVVPVANVQWEVYVWVGSWEPSWKDPLIATVVVASIICGCLIFVLLLSWEENRLLLHSILPEATIQRMKTDMEWKQTSHGKNALRLVEFETPAQHMQLIIQAILAGEDPPMAMVLAVQQALKRSADVYRPANQDLRSKLNAENLDSDVQRHLNAQLDSRLDSDFAFQMFGEDEEEEAETPGLDLILTLPTFSMLSQRPGGEQSGTFNHPRNSHLRTHSSNSPMPINSFRSSGRPGIMNSTSDVHEVLAALVARPDSVQAATINTEDDDLIPATEPRHSSNCSMGTVVEIKPLAVPEKPLMEQLDCVLATADSWTFGIFELDEVTQGHSLSVLGYWLMHKSGCMEHARMDGAVLSRFLRRVEDGYKSLPYHNCRHAADVLQKFHVILQHGGLMPGYCDQLTLLGCYLAAIVHDYEHRGYSNDYLINTNDVLAVRYNDRSPMENHHLAAAWGLMNQPGFNCLSGLSKASWDKLRKLVIELVLATDMRQHFAILGQFSTLHNTSAASPAQMDAIPQSSGGSTSSLVMSPMEALVPSGEHDKLLSLQVALKCADVGNLASPRPVYLRWVAALEEELFLQGDSEHAKGMPISPLCDRTKEGVTKSQVGFFNFVVLPLFGNFTQKFKASRPLLNAVVANYRYWVDQGTTSSGRG